MNGGCREYEMVVAIATSGRAPLLRRTLDSLASCVRPSGYRETVVVENGPPCGAESVVRHADPALKARYMYVSDANKSLALNALLDTVGDCLVFFTDDDVRFERGVLTAYSAASRGMVGQAYLGGPTGVDYEEQPEDWVRALLPASARGWQPDESQARRRDTSFIGFNWAAFAADVRAHGGFDGGRGPGSANRSTGQESDMQRRLRSGGMRPLYVPEALVWHYVPRERSSQEWVVDRAYRSGVAVGLEARAGQLSLLGCPAWVLGRFAKGAIRRIIAIADPSSRRRLEARTRWSYNVGIIRGLRLQQSGGTAEAALARC